MKSLPLAGGCFWCLEAVYQQLPGVERIVSGYMGGEVQNPSYEAVCTGTTGHAEVVQLTFDPAVVSFEEVLGCLFQHSRSHNAEPAGRGCGHAVPRSAIFYHSEAQRETAEKLIATA